MGLSRKRERELNRLRSSASDLWNDQREVLDHASRVVREAGKQVGFLGREELSPRVRGAFDQRIRPGVSSGFAATRNLADTAREKISHDVVPSVASAIASALAVIEVAKDAKVKEVNRQLSAAGVKASKIGAKVGTRMGVVTPPPKRGPGRYILLGLGLVAAAGVAYAAWQTLRDDEDLWIPDETDGIEPTERPAP